ncbi:hypothetical protein K493DRAFT_384950 [Basidiobolus meristosporus CBS 931.73]|uniref:Uncharacterized protein n=1 Tax=Basidiobolus meristosporus CBS 931.73 TaxID=1314790 RepID=A0A1Y1YXX6_9FUNG|nr:hypothetical protein K493DRAFT_384950 [Basidiobolus meristosporus CBS 931.73]|eukprot:ORY02883.1 hypothetical protein K493DRAFT_384950 [Basidiobolus meristosporus CBS 931.73]
MSFPELDEKSLPNVALVVRDITRAKSISLRLYPGTTVRKAIELCCDKFEYWEEWNYGIYSQTLNSWLNDWFSVESYPPETRKSLLLLTKKPDYFELMASRLPVLSKTPEDITKFVAFRQSSFANLFNKTFSALKTKMRPDSLYLSILLFRRDHTVLQTSSGVLPTVVIAEDLSKTYTDQEFDENNEGFAWILKSSMDWEDDTEQFTSFSNSHRQGGKLDLRVAFCEAVTTLTKLLNLKKLGFIYDYPVEMGVTNSKFILAFQYVPDKELTNVASEALKNGILRWKSIESLEPSVYSPSFSILSQCWSIYSARKTQLTPGLYVGLYHLQSTPTGLNILLSSERKHLLPMVKIRDDSELSEEEWEWLKSGKQRPVQGEDILEEICLNLQSSKEFTHMDHFKWLFTRSFLRLQQMTRLSLCSQDIYDVETIEITLPSTKMNNRAAFVRAKDTSTTSDKVRMILIVKPMQMLDESLMFRGFAYHPRLIMYPFRLFGALHHHVHDPTVYDPLRRNILLLQSTIHKAQNDLTASTKSISFSNQQDTTNTRDVIKVLKEKIEELNEKWSSTSWGVRVLDWDRNRSWESKMGHQNGTLNLMRRSNSNPQHSKEMKMPRGAHLSKPKRPMSLCQASEYPIPKPNLV